MLSMPLFAVFAVVLGYALAFAAHGHWTDRYRDQAGVACCGPRDCAPVPGRLLEARPDETLLEVQEVRVWVPTASVHASEDAQFWLCRKDVQQEGGLRRENIRCAFLPSGG